VDGHPVLYKRTEEETQKLLRMEDELHNAGHGQETRSSRRPGGAPHAGGMKDPEAPQRADHMPRHPPAFGKTELARPSPSSCSATRPR